MPCIECGALLVEEIPVDRIWWSTDGRVYVEQVGVCEDCVKRHDEEGS